jgi:cadmium resistance protein CadD (predicted permease)
MVSHILLAGATFIATNIDDLLILSLYFSNPHYRTKNIVLGQYVGIALLIAVSFLGLLVGRLLEDHWISLLGILPLGLGVIGIKRLLQSHPESEETDSATAKTNSQMLSVALVTMANGGDNIGVYAPLFANVSATISFLYALIFLLLTAVWCALAWSITHRPIVRKVLSRYGHVILPVFLVFLGLFIMTNFFQWLMK